MLKSSVHNTYCGKGSESKEWFHPSCKIASFVQIVVAVEIVVIVVVSLELFLGVSYVAYAPILCWCWLVVDAGGGLQVGVDSIADSVFVKIGWVGQIQYQNKRSQ